MDVLDETARLQLLERLTRGTQKGLYEWSSIGDSEYNFVLRAGSFGFAISSRDDDDYAPFELTVFDLRLKEPKAVDEILTGTDRPDLNALLAELYSLVKRRVFKLDTIEAEMFSALDELERGSE
ncbi:hypothetical protein [Cellulosimicrobium cellulans]|uniref:hypothetical protein n=1 Tax=Cellulosimicrobium cellulans TaxID=1710 RepID=UPI00209815B5|nr:hypothetical protein [Cellulosimicrobium cellulans]MCO7275064.1 hypothetical protein [Cellulosimicrobium cellulans]